MIDTSFPILSLMTFLPLLSVGFILAIRGAPGPVAANARSLALWTSAVNGLLLMVLVGTFDHDRAGFQFVENMEWLASLSIQYRMGVDGISLWFIALSVLLIPICILASASIKDRTREYMALLMVSQTLLIGTFSALDAVVFYLFFEGSLIPMFLIIGIWGHSARVFAAFKFFLYTLAGSVLFLVAILVLHNQVGSTDIEDLAAATLSPSLQYWLWWAFFASFAIKIPMWPFHTWLPAAHVQAPTGGSVLLAGVLLKLGGYGFLRFSLPILPDASDVFAPVIFVLSAIGVIYASFVAWGQSDMKKLIAYSSVAHMAFVTAGIFTFDAQGVNGAVFQMVSHGLVSAMLFVSVGFLYDRVGTYHIAHFRRYAVLAKAMPFFAVLYMVASLAALGLPITSAFVGEFLTLLASWKVSILLAASLAFGMILSAVYMLGLYRDILFVGIDQSASKDKAAPPAKTEEKDPDAAMLADLTGRELTCLVPLALLVLVAGILPMLFLDTVEPSVSDMLGRFSQRLTPGFSPIPEWLH